MKMKVTVVIEKDIVIEIPDECLTPESIKEFQESFWKIEGTDDLFKYAGVMIANHDQCFIEGLGQAVPLYRRKPDEIGFEVIGEDHEATLEDMPESDTEAQRDELQSLSHR